MAMIDELEMIPLTGPFRTSVRVPGSKSITNRAFVLAALARGETELSGVLLADDSRQMMGALQAIGYSLQIDEAARRVRVFGLGNAVPEGDGSTLSCGNSGTTIRFLAAMLALGRGEYVLDGIARMRQRPIGQLVEQLRRLGAEIEYAGHAGFPPVRVRAVAEGGLEGGGCSFEDAKSSQYISAILMAAPYAKNGVVVNLLGAITSEPYVVMTLRMMEQFGVQAAVHDQCGTTLSRSIQVPARAYRVPAGGHYAIEPDASNASYFLAAAAVTPGSSATVEGLGKNSLQGDVAFGDVLGKMGATVEWRAEGITVTAPADGKLHGIELDMNHIPDMVQTLCVTALFADGPTTVRNVWNLRVKETDRLAALESELRKLGAAVETGTDWIRVTPPVNHLPAPVSIATYDDHRMAMAFAIAGLRAPGIRIQNPDCTAKTYPEFFDDLKKATA